VEGAVVIPFLFVLVFGVLEFSYYFYQQHLVTTGVRDAALYLAKCGQSPTSIQTCDPTSSAAQTAAQNLAATGSVAGGSMRRVSGFDPEDVSINFAFVDDAIGADGVRPYRPSPLPADANLVRIVQVTGSFTWTPLGFWDFFGFGTKNITVQQIERYVGNG